MRSHRGGCVRTVALLICYQGSGARQSVSGAATTRQHFPYSHRAGAARRQLAGAPSPACCTSPGSGRPCRPAPGTAQTPPRGRASFWCDMSARTRALLAPGPPSTRGWHDTARHGTAMHDPARQCTTRHDKTRHGTASATTPAIRQTSDRGPARRTEAAGGRRLRALPRLPAGYRRRDVTGAGYRRCDVSVKCDQMR